MAYLDKLRREPYFKKRDHVKITDNKLGEGAYGSVYIGECCGQPCAVKVIHSYLVQSQSSQSLSKPLEQFLQECAFTSKTHNEHIVKFLGASISSPDGEIEVPVLITELMECSLTAVLECKFCGLPYDKEVDVARGIASGLDYLHTRSPSIVHRDLSSNNILLAANYTAKIADLGVAKCLGASSCSPVPGTTAYMPPEVFTRQYRLSVAIDLFSYGVLMVQLETTKFPDPKDDVEEERTLGESYQEGGGTGDEGKHNQENPHQDDDKDETLTVKPEIERRRNHLQLMDESGVFYRIAIQYLQDKSSKRRQTQLKEVMKWLEEETHTKKYKDSIIDPMTPLEHRLQCLSKKGKTAVATNSAGAIVKKLKSMTSSTQESGYFSQPVQKRNTAPLPTAHIVEHQGGSGLQVAGARPQSTSGRERWRSIRNVLSQIPSRLGLATNNEDDKQYLDRVMKSL